MYALLIAEDPDDVAIFSTILHRAGLAVTTTRDLERVLQNWSERPADMILIASPHQSAVEQVRQVRAETLVPLALVLSQADELLQCELLKLGADLVVSPPFGIKLLIAQIGVLMRRANSVPAFALPTLVTANLTLQPESRTVEVAGKPPQRLTHLEFRLLYTLMMNRGQTIPIEALIERVWGYTGQGDRDLVRGLVSRLRAKVEVNPRQPHYILTNPGIGYVFKGDDDE